MTFQYPVEIARDLVAMTSQFSQQSMEVHGVALIEKLFDVACSLTDVLSLLPARSDPFTLGPRDYLHQFMSLLSVLRNGDTRFLPLLLQKVHDVLPTLANPMLQTVPETTNMCADVDIFDGFGNSGMIPQTFTPMQSRPTEFKLENPGLPFDKRIDHLGSPSVAQNSDNSPFTSPAIMSPSMEFPGMSKYNGFPDLNHGMEFKREFDAGNHGLSNMRMTPARSDSASSFGISQVPRSVSEYHHLQRGNSGGGDVGINGVNDLPFR
jgi:hypothetical protein